MLYIIVQKSNICIAEETNGISSVSHSSIPEEIIGLNDIYIEQLYAETSYVTQVKRFPGFYMKKILK